MGAGNFVQAQRLGRTELTATEQQLMAEMMQLARKLDKKNVLGVYGIVADTVQAVSERKVQGLEAIAVLARGMDMLNEHAAKKRAQRLSTVQETVHVYAEGSGVHNVFYCDRCHLLACRHSWLFAGLLYRRRLLRLRDFGLVPFAMRLWYSR